MEVNATAEISVTFDGICRCCLSSSICKSMLLPITKELNETYAEMIEKCFGLNVQSSVDPLESKPQINSYLICKMCICKLEFCVEFKQLITETQRVFNNIKVERQMDDDSATKEICTDITPDLNSGSNAASMLEFDESRCKFTKRESKTRRLSKSKDLVIKEEVDGEIDDSNLDNDWSLHLSDDLEYKPEVKIKPVKLSKPGKKNTKGKVGNKQSRKLSTQKHRDENCSEANLQSEPENDVSQNDNSEKEILPEHRSVEGARKATSTQRAREIRSAMDEQNLQCKICSKTFLNNRSLKVHINEHYSDYVCEVCGRGFALKAIYQNHFRRHVVGEFPCRRCGEKLASKGQYDAHVAKHRGRERYVCRLCPERFAAFYSREKHMRDAHDVNKKYKCEHCAESFLVKSMLDKHRRRRHAQRERNVSCELCGKGFYEAMLLKRHMVVHVGERVFKCDVCLKAYPRMRTLSDHMKIHNNVRDHVCNVCGKAFVQACSLRSHLKMHEKEKSKMLQREDVYKVKDISNNGVKSGSEVIISAAEALPGVL